jgi:glycine dehydrogenase subunit 1
MSLLGPKGMKELGETILEKSHYTANIIAGIDGVEIPFSSFFKEFPVKFSKTVNDVNKKLLKYKIFGGKDLTREYPEFGDSALYCVTEVHNLEMIERLEKALREIVV